MEKRKKNLALTPWTDFYERSAIEWKDIKLI